MRRPEDQSNCAIKFNGVHTATLFDGMDVIATTAAIFPGGILDGFRTGMPFRQYLSNAPIVGE
jgi:hypothetical protein